MNTADETIGIREARRAFAPLDKRAFGVAWGVTGGLLVFVLTAFHLTVMGGDSSGIRLLREYFYGYEVSWTGALIGAFWGFVACFAMGWFAAFNRNFFMALTLVVARARNELAETADFLDHI